MWLQLMATKLFKNARVLQHTHCHMSDDLDDELLTSQWSAVLTRPLLISAQLA